jgi:hypothetical protein
LELDGLSASIIVVALVLFRAGGTRAGGLDRHDGVRLQVVLVDVTFVGNHILDIVRKNTLLAEFGDR